MPSSGVSLRCRSETGTVSPSGACRLQAARHVGGRIVPARHLLALAQRARASQVVVPDLVRRRHRRIVEAQPIGVELVAALGAERIGFLGERDRVLFAARDVAHHDARQAVLALEPDQPIRESVTSSTIARRAGAGRDRASSRGRRGQAACSTILKSSAPSALVRMISTRRPSRMMLDVVLHRRLARRDQPRLRVRIGEIDQPAFRRLVIVHRNDREAAGLRAAERDEETSCPVPRRRARRRSPACRAGGDRRARADDWRRAARSRTRANRRSRRRARGVGNDLVGQVAAGAKIAHAHRVDIPSPRRRPTRRAADGRANARAPPSWK